ncbi:MAG: ribbon-helix-helix protein, CopG family [Chloroflexi bacterium]|nr:ribbon-helix-helix protein, CopG family [Chloroflexota bacterium]
MVKKIIQVPVDEELLKDLDRLSKKQRKARSEVIREACVIYLARVKEEELDRIYREGYKRIPEDPAEIEALTALASEVLPKEEW